MTARPLTARGRVVLVLAALALLAVGSLRAGIRWASIEGHHCTMCDCCDTSCPSKDGRR